MGLFSWVKEKYQDLKEKCREIKEKARDFCDNLSTRMENWREKAERKYEEIKETVGEIKEKAKEKIREIKVRHKHPGYKPTKPDQELATKAKTYLDNKFPRGIKETLRDQTSEERLNTINQVVSDASSIMDVKVNSVEYFEPDPAHRSICGFYDRDTNTMHLNAYMVTSDHPELSTEQVYTVFHEMVHARQWAAVTGKKDYEYPPETILEWAYNFRNYIYPVEGDRDYRKQPLERDAFGFEAIIKGEVTIEEFIKYNS